MSEKLTPLALRADWMRLTRLASSGFSTFRWSATGSSMASAGTSASSSGSADEICSRLTPMSAGIGDPVLDGEVGIGPALVARRELLQRGAEDADLHVFRA